MLNQLDNIKKLVADDFAAVDRLVTEHLSQEIPLIEQLCCHLMNSGGKRLRPLILLLAAKACYYSGDKQIKLAAAVEYFHTATLLHDDVVDESTLRRGQKTANEIFGNKTCILVGDFLFTQSFQWVIASQNLDIFDLFARMANEVSRGEIKQLSLRHQTEVRIEDYFEVIRSKTALLFSASTELGAHLTGSPLVVREALRNYGLYLGNAFQMVDDALDYCSSSEAIGKNIGDDLADGKLTLPLICAIDRGTPLQVDIIKKNIKKGTLENFPEILKIIEETEAVAYTYQQARDEAQKAIAALQVLEDSPYKEGLIQLAYFSVSRTH